MYFKNSYDYFMDDTYYDVNDVNDLHNYIQLMPIVEVQLISQIFSPLFTRQF